MTLAIPYWWSKKCYDITMDEIRGGWRAFWFRIEFQRNRNWRSGFSIDVYWANGAIFPRRP
jgi:hypothetical protein